MSRHLLAVLLVLLNSLPLFAGPVTLSQAQKAAEAFLQQKGLSVQAGQGPAKARAYTKGATELPAYYIFNATADGGFVVVSGDDRTTPILGYTDEGVYDEAALPANLKAWLNGYVDQIRRLDDNEAAASPAANGRKDITFHEPDWDEISPILRTTWNQGAPFNTYCPVFEGTIAPTGCVATALAQVMYHHRWPQSSTATIPAYTQQDPYYNHATLPPTVFDWDNMPLTQYETDVNNASAQLLRYVGRAVQMHYGMWESSSYASNALLALINYFGYHSGAQYLTRGVYGAHEWHAMVYEELAQGRPLYYDGQSTGGGHAFVCDGYDGDGYYHINWGWGGYCDGYFLLEVLNPYGSGIGGSNTSDGYYMTQGAIFGVQPNVGVPNPERRLTSDFFYSEGNTVLANFWNRTAFTGNFEYGIGLANADGSVTPLITYYYIDLPSMHGFSKSVFQITPNLFPGPGTYAIVPITREYLSGNDWQLSTGAEKYVEAILNEKGVTLTTRPEPALEIAELYYDTDMYTYTDNPIIFTVENTGNSGFDCIYLFASKTEEKVYHTQTKMIDFPAMAPLTLALGFTPTSTGEWNLWLTTDAEGTQLLGDVLRVQVKNNPDLPVGKYLFRNFTYADYLTPTKSKTMIGTDHPASRSVWEVNFVDGGCTLQNVATGLYAKPGSTTSSPWTLTAKPDTLFCYINDGGQEGIITFGSGETYGKMHQDAAGNIVNWCTQIETGWYLIPYTEDLDEELAAVEEDFLADDIANAQDMKNIAKVLGVELTPENVTLTDIINNNPYQTVAGKYYRFTHKSRKKNIGLNAAGLPVGVEASAMDADQIWQLVPHGNGFKLFNPNRAAADPEKAYLSDVETGSLAPAATMCAEADAQVYSIKVVYLASKTFAFTEAGNTDNCIRMEAEGHESGDYILTQSKHNAFCNFTMEQVNSLEVELKPILPNMAYATVYLPFDVATDDSEVKAYVARSVTGSTLDMVETTGVKALNGFVLECPEAKTATLRITKGEEAAESILKGTTVALTLDATNRNHYLLLGHVADEHAPGFYVTTDAAVPANSAFADNAGGLYADGLRLIGTADGLEEIRTESRPEAPIFDLTGRRVQQMNRKGIYIQDGKKVLR